MRPLHLNGCKGTISSLTSTASNNSFAQYLPTVIALLYMFAGPYKCISVN